jgi:predicted NBD/HSP70 family sugar kinase
MGVGDLSRGNSIRILEQLLDEGPTSRTDLGRALRLAPATVNRLTGRLEDEGLVVDTGVLAHTGGRPSRLLDFNREYRLLVTVDVADHHTSVAMADLGGNLLERHDIPTAGDAEQRYADVFGHVATVLEDPGERCSRVACLGVSVPGPVDDDGTVLFAPALGWHGKPLRADLERSFGVPAVVENDANLIALAEHSSGHWGATKSLVAIAVFDGIGSGIIEDGRLWRGASGAAGQIGRLLVEKDSLSNEYTGFGDFESHIGAASLVRRARALGIPDTAEAPLDADEILRRYAGGDLAARGLVDEVLDEFAMSLVNVCALLAPEVIVFSGLFDRWGSVVLPGLRDRLRGHVVHLPILAPGALGDEAALAGAARLAFDHVGAVAGLLPEES